MKFSELNLHPSLLSAIEKLNYQECTPIQATIIPAVLEGKDAAGLAQTGTGKTAAFLLPLMDRILRSRQNPEELQGEELELHKKRALSNWRPANYVLVLVPTRELAEQVFNEVGRLRGEATLDAVAVYGGTSYEKQIDGLKRNVDFVVGTPGRLIDLYKTHRLDLQQARGVVFDEADRMFDMGFKDDMKYILKRLPKDRQFLVFSATLNFEVLNVAYMFGAEPVEFNVSRDQSKAENVKDQIFHVGQDDKPQYLLSIIKRESPRQVIIFSNFKHSVERIARFLSRNGFPAVGISSLLTQAQRNRVMEQFKAENDQNILVATDVAARGLDIKGVDMIINCELPDDPENYVHRIGRTGRAGREGKAFSLVSDRDVDALMRVEEYLKHKVDVGWMETDQLIKDFLPVPEDKERFKPTPTMRERRPPRESRPTSRHTERHTERPTERLTERPQRRDHSHQRPPPRMEPPGPLRVRPLRTEVGQARTVLGEKKPPQQGERPQGRREPVHRDRLSGRHDHTRGEGARSGAPRPEGRRHESRKPNSRRPHSSGHRRSSPQMATTQASGPNLAKKVSSFFKKLFGSEK